MKRAVVSLLSALTGAAIGAGAAAMAAGKTIRKTAVMSEKHFELFTMMNQWVKVKQEGKNLASYLDVNGYKTVAVYGMSYAGETLVNELKESDVTIAYGIDRNADSMYAVIDLVRPDDDLQTVDAVIVSAIAFFDEIEEELSGKMSCPILSLEDILYEL